MHEVNLLRCSFEIVAPESEGNMDDRKGVSFPLSLALSGKQTTRLEETLSSDGLRSALHSKEGTRGPDSRSVSRILRVFYATKGEHRDLASSQLLRPGIRGIHPS